MIKLIFLLIYLFIRVVIASMERGLAKAAKQDYSLGEFLVVTVCWPGILLANTKI